MPAAGLTLKAVSKSQPKLRLWFGTPAGTCLQVEGQLIKWQRWHIRFTFNYREGLVGGKARRSGLQRLQAARCHPSPAIQAEFPCMGAARGVRLWASGPP